MSKKKDGTDENGDVKQAGIEDSNLANYGSKEHIDARKKAAQSEKEFAGAGKKPGLEIWRVENRRTEKDTPDFGVKRWPTTEYGNFFSGDSYLILNTYFVKVDGKVTDKLAWDVHFWLGRDSSQDEIGVAAYKAVELDDLLDDGPVQHRETQENESSLFQSYFDKGITYMEGGIASGFRHVKPTEYKPRLFQCRRTRKTCRCTEVPVKATSINSGDVFILDAGTEIYTYIGSTSNAFEKMKAGFVVNTIVNSRLGKAKAVPVNEDFWKVLGGSEKDVQPPVPEVEEKETDKDIDVDNCQLWRLSDATGKMEFKKESEGRIKEAQLDTNDIFIIDAKSEIFIWVGNGSSSSEKQQCMKTASDYLKKTGRPETIPVTRIKEGQIHHHFGSIIIPKASGGLADIQRAKKLAEKADSKLAKPTAPAPKKLW